MTKNNYVVWTAFEKTLTVYYVINIETKKIQSKWDDYIVARAVCDDLNKKMALSVA